METTADTGGKSEAQLKASDRLRSQTATVKEDIRELGRATRDVAQEKLHGAREAAAQYIDHGRARAQDLEGQMSTYIRERPIKSVCIAAGIGVVLGILLGRR